MPHRIRNTSRIAENITLAQFEKSHLFSIMLKVNIFYKYFFYSGNIQKFPPFFEFLLYEMFFGLPLDVDLKSQKFKKCLVKVTHYCNGNEIT